DGLAASLEVDGTRVEARRWLLEELIDAADAGLARLGIATGERDRYLGIVRARTASGQTGAAWQRAGYLAHGRDAYALMAAYCELQRSGAPVHEWPRPGTAR
ncbi:MAG: glutamate--cysteine ligase, partial [Gammaproteobacteria bacterium]